MEKRMRVRLALIALGLAGLITQPWWDLQGPLAIQGLSVWPTALLFTVLHAVAVRFLVSTPDSLWTYGYTTALEVMMMLLVPMRMVALGLAVSVLVALLWVYRVKRRFRQSEVGGFGATMIAIAAAKGLHIYLSGLLPEPHLASLLLLPTIVTFVAIQNGILAVTLSVAHRIPIKQLEFLHRDTLLSDLLMGLAGGLAARLWFLDPSALVLVAVPTALLYRILQNVQQARLARLDAKTGLYNYRHLDEVLADRVKKSEASGTALSLLFLDMDHLRDVNNTYGHLTGDKALKAVATAMQRITRASDVAARFGGEEFVLLLPGTGKGEAVVIAERLRREVAGSSVTADDGTTFPVTVSIGVASMPTDGRKVEELVRAADAAVYEAKRTGRNRVCAYAPDLSEQSTESRVAK